LLIKSIGYLLADYSVYFPWFSYARVQSPIVFGYPGAMGKIEGDKEISIGEYRLLDADYWTSKYAPRN